MDFKLTYLNLDEFSFLFQIPVVNYSIYIFRMQLLTIGKSSLVNSIDFTIII